MTDRTFHRKFTPTAKAGVAALSLLMGYCFWVKEVVVAVLCMALVVFAIEKVLHSEYVFRDNRLIIRKGRFSKEKAIPVGEIVRCTRMTTAFGLVSYLVIEYGHLHLEDVEPDNEQAFMKELRRRQDETI